MITKDNKHLISSTKEFETFLHRCTKGVADKTKTGGLVCGPNPLSSMTHQPREEVRARQMYERGENNYGDRTVVVQIPTDLWDTARRESPGEETLHGAVGYYNEGEHDFAIHPRFVKAIINRNTGDFELVE